MKKFPNGVKPRKPISQIAKTVPEHKTSTPKESGDLVNEACTGHADMRKAAGKYKYAIKQGC